MKVPSTVYCIISEKGDLIRSHSGTTYFRRRGDALRAAGRFPYHKPRVVEYRLIEAEAHEEPQEG